MNIFWVNKAQGTKRKEKKKKKTHMDVELYILPLAETRELVAIEQIERF